MDVAFTARIASDMFTCTSPVRGRAHAEQEAMMEPEDEPRRCGAEAKLKKLFRLRGDHRS